MSDTSKIDVVVYGLGKFFHNYRNDIFKNYNVKALFDKNLEGTFENYPIYNLTDIDKYKLFTFLIMVKSKEECSNIMDLLLEKGVCRDNILVGYEVFAEEEQKKIKEREQYKEYCENAPVNDKKIVMLIGIYGSHAKQITKRLLEMNKGLDIVWVINEKTKMRDEYANIRIIRANDWKAMYYEMNTAKVWLWDDLAPSYIKKKDNQIYIQAKHWSSITLKKFYLDDKSPLLTEAVAEGIKQDGARMDYLFSGSSFDENSCISGFNFKGKALRVGSPRSDLLFQPDSREKVLAEYGIESDSKICLYVPTYRITNLDKPNSVEVSLDMEGLLNALKKKWDSKWYLLVRVHPCLQIDWGKIGKNKYIRNAEQYPESEELVSAADVMITDYSSIMFEQAYKNGAVFLFAPDKQEFVEGERSLLLDYDSLPFPIAETNDNLFKNIQLFEENEYKKLLASFFDKYGVHEDGNASKRAAEAILDMMNQ